MDQHDPKTKQQLKDMLYHYLYDPVIRRFNERLVGIIREHGRLTTSALDCFSYKGIYYAVNPQEKPPRLVPRLHKSLYAAMDTYLAELKVINDEEVPFVLGFITQVLNASDNLHDYIRALPASVHRPLQDVIDRCGCKTSSLPEKDLQTLLVRNSQSINLMKQRMVLNLLL